VDSQRWLEQYFGCRLGDERLLEQALSHRSVGSRNNERLEFLGDAVLSYVISEDLYSRFPTADEGQLSRLRVSLVKGSALAHLARELDLSAQLRLGSGERSGGGRQRASILADTLEAVLGAIALDQGIAVARDAVRKIFASRLSELHLDQALKDPKTRLQEFLQARQRPLPEYRLLSTEGEEHARSFTVACVLSDGGDEATGQGSSRRAAEQQAAQRALDVLVSA